MPSEATAGQGPRLTALIGELSGSQRGSRSAVQGLPVVLRAISAGEPSNARRSGLGRDRPVYEAIAAKAQPATVSYMIDQLVSARRVDVVVGDGEHHVALFKVQAHRNTAAFEALIERWAGTWSAMAMGSTASGCMGG